MNLDKTIKWGIMGCGKIAHKFAQDLNTIPNAELRAVASRDLKKAKEFGNIHHAFTCYGSYEELATNPEIDVIYIATPHVFHYKNTLMCLTNKKAVLCEKPFAMNLEQVKEMIAVAQQHEVFLMEALWTYFLPHYNYVIDIINSKKMGEIKSLKADFGFAADFDLKSRLFNKSLGGGSLLDIGIYPIFVALSLLGYPEDISATANFSVTDIDEECTISFGYQNGVQAELHSTLIEETNTEVTITLENGSIIINSRFHEPSSVTITENNISRTIEFPVATIGYNFEAIHVQEMLLENQTESTIMTFDKSMQLISLLDRVRHLIGLSYD